MAPVHIPSVEPGKAVDGSSPSSDPNKGAASEGDVSQRLSDPNSPCSPVSTETETEQERDPHSGWSGGFGDTDDTSRPMTEPKSRREWEAVVTRLAAMSSSDCPGADHRTLTEFAGAASQARNAAKLKGATALWIVQWIPLTLYILSNLGGRSLGAGFGVFSFAWLLFFGCIRFMVLSGKKKRALALGRAIGFFGSGMATMATTASACRACPQCAETIKAEALMCRFCGLRFSEADVATARENAQRAIQREQLRLAESRKVMDVARLRRGRFHRLLWGWLLVAFCSLLVFGNSMAYMQGNIVDKGEPIPFGAFVCMLLFMLGVLGLPGVMLLRKARKLRETIDATLASA